MFAIFTYHMYHQQKLCPVLQQLETSVQWNQPWCVQSSSKTWLVGCWVGVGCRWSSECVVPRSAPWLFYTSLVGMFALVGISHILPLHSTNWGRFQNYQFLLVIEMSYECVRTCSAAEFQKRNVYFGCCFCAFHLSLHSTFNPAPGQSPIQQRMAQSIC